jgi:hypothetical protein
VYCLHDGKGKEVGKEQGPVTFRVIDNLLSLRIATRSTLQLFGQLIMQDQVLLRSLLIFCNLQLETRSVRLAEIKTAEVSFYSK